MTNLADWWSILVGGVDYRKWILRAIRARARITKQDEGDLLNEVLRRAAEAANRNRLPVPELIGPWLSRIARNVLAEYRRHQFREGPALEEVMQVPAAGKSLENQAIENELWGRIERAIEDLPPRLRESYLLVEIEGLPPTEVCVKLHCGRTTLWENVREAEKQLHLPLSLAFIEGTVVKSSGSIEKRACVELRSPLFSGPRARRGGTFFFKWLPPTRYQLTVLLPEYGKCSKEIEAHAGANPIIMRID